MLSRLRGLSSQVGESQLQLLMQPVWSVLRAVFAMGPNILRAAWTVICSVSTSTSFETVCARPASILKRQVPLLFLGRWLLNIALRQLRRTKSYRNVTLQR